MGLKLSQISHEEKDVDDIVQEVLTNRFDHRKPLPPQPEYAITIGGKGLVEKGGSLIGVYGLPKTRKSSLIGMIAAAALNENKTHGLIETPHVDGEILWFDTEMGLYRELPRFHNHIIDMAGRRGAEHDDYLLKNYHVSNLRPYSHDERLAAIDRIITAPNLFDNVGMMVLDGVADVMENTNEAAQAKAVVDRLLMWADKKSCPLFVALHLNQSSSATKPKAAGFAGNYLYNKSSYNIISKTEYEGSPSIIVPGMTRNGKRFNPFMITNIEEGKEGEGRPIFYDPEMDYLETEHGFASNSRQNNHLDSSEIENLLGI